MAAAQATLRRVGSRDGQADGLRVVPSAKTRQRGIYASSRSYDFRARGVSPDTWHLRPTREAMAEAPSRAEDALEVESRGRMTAARVELRGIRRRVERELWS